MYIKSVIQEAHGRVVKGEYRISAISSRVSRIGKRYVRVQLEDSSGYINAYMWKPENFSNVLMSINNQDPVKITGRVKVLDNCVLDILEIENLAKTGKSSDAFLLPRSSCPVPAELDKMVSIIEQIKSPLLLRFCHNSFADLNLAEKFLSIPASFKNHDSEPGGLLSHTVKVVEKVLLDPLLTYGERDISVVGALFHDCGKIWTHAANKPGSTYLDHDLLTLEVLARPLSLLQGVEPEIANELRYLWTYKRMYPRRPAVFATARAVHRADCESAKESLDLVI